jgi:hypothetical protein
MEIETQIMIAERLGYVESVAAGDLLCSSAELGKILNGLINSLN